ncbi:Sensor histidine kinase RcsC [Paenibacillus allorhizosphaerae]|uniref:histidine kinase n=1 Tax=Paenibacillus allorhizosphaerae TaxID=2849866 RepID=A0ABM8VEM6_9BACL|nr:Sensor histidine kinase RcsC [Paenibacillus allorhizosphaerae]
MTRFDKELAFLREHKGAIIGNWQVKIRNAYPGYYEGDTLLIETGRYFEYITGLHIPKEQHEIMSNAPNWAKRLVENNIPLHHILRSHHYWRSAMHEVLGESRELEVGRVLILLNELEDRMQYYQETVCHIFLELTNAKLSEQERAIIQLHDDRLNLIGKMAASMAHEIRNPLTSIKGFLKLIRENMTNEDGSKVYRYLNVVENEFENIHMQITGLLSFSKKRVMEEPFVQVTPRQLLDSVVSLLNPRFLNENVNLSIELLEEELLTIQKVAVQQVISNIINNGLDALTHVKHDKEMMIRGYVESETYVIEFTNNGPAIRPEIQKTLFEPFVTDKVEGTGLGLAICKTIMQKNNGGISFISVDERTTFTLNFQIREMREA